MRVTCWSNEHREGRREIQTQRGKTRDKEADINRVKERLRETDRDKQTDIETYRDTYRKAETDRAGLEMDRNAVPVREMHR